MPGLICKSKRFADAFFLDLYLTDCRSKVERGKEEVGQRAIATEVLPEFP
jgi:hypothetical protein